MLARVDQHPWQQLQTAAAKHPLRSAVASAAKKQRHQRLCAAASRTTLSVAASRQTVLCNCSGQAGELVEAVASGLAAGAGLNKPGARVGVYGANCREWMIAMQVSPDRLPLWPVSGHLLIMQAAQGRACALTQLPEEYNLFSRVLGWQAAALRRILHDRQWLQDSVCLLPRQRASNGMCFELVQRPRSVETRPLHCPS